MAATLFVFTSFVTLVWLTSWSVSSLYAVHALSDETLQLIKILETVLIYIDAALCLVVVIRGLWQYIVSVTRGDS